MTFKKTLITSAAVVVPAIVLFAGAHLNVAQANHLANPYTNVLGNDLGLFYVNVSPSSYYVTQGGMISFTGSHFYPGETVSVMNNGMTMGTVMANSDGSISTPQYMVTYAGGNQAYTLTGATSNIPYTVNVAVRSANPWVTLSSYYAGAGSSVSVMAHGFGSNEKVTVWYDGMEAGHAMTDMNGDVTVTMTVPAGAQWSSHTVKAMGEMTGVSATQMFTQSY